MSRNLSCLGIGICVIQIITSRYGSAQQTEQKEAVTQEAAVRAADKFQHLSVLADMPADHMGKVMNIMSEALGVNCTHCHTGYDFAKEGSAQKDKARQMLTMTLEINRQHFQGRSVVSCVTCHQGQAVPADATQAANAWTSPKKQVNTFAPFPPAPARSADSQPSIDAIWSRFQTQVKREPLAGGRLSWQAVRQEAGGRGHPEEVLLESASHWQLTTKYGQVKIVERFQAGRVEKLSGDQPIVLKADELMDIKIEAHLELGLDLRPLFQDWSIQPPVMIDDREMNVVQARVGDATHRFYFDHQTGWLRCRTAALSTLLGAHVTKVSYRDYRRIAGAMRPATISVDKPSVHWKRQVP